MMRDREPATGATNEAAIEDRRATEETRVPVVRNESSPAAEHDVALLPEDRLGRFRAAWEEIQIGFVDEPRAAVQSAHDLVDRLVNDLADSFRRQRESLEGTWGQGSEDTEALRLALQRYRSFFNRLLRT